ATRLPLGGAEAQCSFVSDDDRTIFYTRPITSGSSDYALFISTRSSGLVEFGGEAMVANIDGPGSEFWPWISGNELYFAAAGGGPFILRTTRRPDGSFNTPAPVSELTVDAGGLLSPALR